MFFEGNKREYEGAQDWAAKADAEAPIRGSELEADFDSEAHDHIVEAFGKVPSPLDLTELYLKRDGTLFGDVMQVLRKRAKKETLELKIDLRWDELGHTDEDRMKFLPGLLSFATDPQKNQERQVKIHVPEAVIAKLQREEAVHTAAPHYLDSPIQFIVD